MKEKFSKSNILQNLNIFNISTNQKLIIDIINIINILLVLLLLLIGNSSNYKLLFLFIIITATIQFGKSYGISISFVCSAFVLIIDLMSYYFAEVKNFFETDIVLSMIFMLTSYILGYYVNAEKEYRDKLFSLESKDDLTGLYNHSFIQEELTREFNLCRKSDLPICLLLIDIDYFKSYNYIYGYKEGNRVLETIGSLFKKNVKDTDIVGRYSEKEFVVILPNTSSKEAFLIGEKIRKEIENYNFSGEDSEQKTKITVSIGLSCFPDKSKNKQQLIKNAEDALCRAKYFNKKSVERESSILDYLKEDIEDKHFDLISTIKTLLSVINSKDGFTYEHTERVVIYCDLLANKLSLSDGDRKTLLYGAYLHDVGKINIPKEILSKKEPLTEEQWNILKKHCENGAEIIKDIDSLENLIPLILYHHERYDGRGYPLGLRKNDIPYLVRILTVADSFDAMTSNRPYKNRMSHDEAIEELRRCSNTQFDPEIVEAFIEII